MSVGTPSIMSNIPQVIEVLEEYDFIQKAQKWLFNVYDDQDLEKKLYFALEHFEELKENQQELYDLLNRRTWKDVGKEYIFLFERLLN